MNKGRPVRTWLCALGALLLAVIHTSPADAARGVSTPSTPNYDLIATTIVYSSDYHQDYGDPRCPSGVDEATHECWTMYFTLGLVMTGGRFVPVNPQHGCGPQDNCTYVTSVPCPQTRSDPPEEDLWGAEFYQRIVDHSSVGPIDPRSPTVPGSDDVRSSGHVYLFRCQLRFTGAPTVR